MRAVVASSQTSASLSVSGGVDQSRSPPSRAHIRTHARQSSPSPAALKHPPIRSLSSASNTLSVTSLSCEQSPQTHTHTHSDTDGFDAHPSFSYQPEVYLPHHLRLPPSPWPRPSRIVFCALGVGGSWNVNSSAFATPGIEPATPDFQKLRRV